MAFGHFGLDNWGWKFCVIEVLNERIFRGFQKIVRSRFQERSVAEELRLMEELNQG